jgi:hypothetical protein
MKCFSNSAGLETNDKTGGFRRRLVVSPSLCVSRQSPIGFQTDATQKPPILGLCVSLDFRPTLTDATNAKATATYPLFGRAPYRDADQRRATVHSQCCRLAAPPAPRAAAGCWISAVQAGVQKSKYLNDYGLNLILVDCEFDLRMPRFEGRT